MAIFILINITFKKDVMVKETFNLMPVNTRKMGNEEKE